MKILQKPISVNHKSAMFFDGLVAECDGNTLTTYNDGELYYKDKLYVGAEIRELGETGAVNDGDIEAEVTVNILVDKFFVINNDEDKIFVDYDEAIQEFETFLNNLS